jgi:CDP-diacylglycerol--glycerol-3-phosphate 3-phosphatidyltransferase
MNILKFRTIAIDSLTWYRIVAAPVLLILVLADYPDVFKWLLVLSFLTDAIDGPLSRRYKTASANGARLDSLGDDLTVAVALAGMVRWNYVFLTKQWEWLVLLLLLLAIEMTLALVRYGKMTAFHTYLSKTAAVLQALYLCYYFLIGVPPVVLFYLAISVTAIGLIEEIILVLLLKDYRCDVKGLYQLWRQPPS